MRVILPGGTIGIIGGGQLGRMTSLAASAMGYKTHIFSPQEDCPGSQVSTLFTCSSYDDKEALEKFASSVDVVSFEFENIPTSTVKFLEETTNVHPSSKALNIAQNRIREKSFFNDIGVPTNFYGGAKSLEELKEVYSDISSDDNRVLIKTAELGYDGKGQVVIDKIDGLENAWERLGKKEVIVEEFVDFVKEISVVLARGVRGETTIYPVSENKHVGGILHTTTVPANIDEKIEVKAKKIALNIAEGLNLVGLVAVEMFETRNGEVLVNEIAPRPHNSGHWTMDGCVTSQFEQLVRAICGIPLGSVDKHSDIRMRNIIGSDVNDIADILKDPLAKLHLYGKAEAREGRKMGHVNYIRLLKD